MTIKTKTLPTIPSVDDHTLTESFQSMTMVTTEISSSGQQPGTGDESGLQVHYKLPASLVNILKQKRQSERDRLNALNGRLSEYIDRVKYLEDINDRLNSSIVDLKNKYFENCQQTKQTNEKQLVELRESLNYVTQQKMINMVKNRQLNYLEELTKCKFNQLLDEAKKSTEKVDALNEYNEKLKEELVVLRAEVNDSINSLINAKQENKVLEDKLRNLNIELDESAINRMKHQLQIKTIEEEILFSKALSESIRTELGYSNEAEKLEMDKQFYKNEIEKSIGDIRTDFARLIEMNRVELEEWYTKKVSEAEKQAEIEQAKAEEFAKVEQEYNMLNSVNDEYLDDVNQHRALNQQLEQRFQELNNRLDRLKEQKQSILFDCDHQIESLKAEIENQSNSFNIDKCTLDAELTIYKRILDIFSSRLEARARETELIQAAEQRAIEATATSHDNDVVGKIRTFREMNGPVGIKNISLDNRSITLENVSGERVDLADWILVRKIDDYDELVYFIPKGASLAPGSSLRVWANDGTISHEDLGSDLINRNVSSWGTGSVTYTRLLSPGQQVKSTLTQKIVTK